MMMYLMKPTCLLETFKHKQYDTKTFRQFVFILCVNNFGWANADAASLVSVAAVAQHRSLCLRMCSG